MAWTEERRRKASENARKNKPWLKSTGPRTRAGKIRSCMNAFRHGERSIDLEAARKALGHHRACAIVFCARYARKTQNELIKT